MVVLNAVELDKYIDAVLTSIVDAERSLFISYVEAFKDLFFQEKDDVLEPIEITLKYTRSYVADDGTLKTTTEKVSIPLISLAPYPPLTIDDVDISIGYQVTYVEKGDKGKVIGLPSKSYRKEGDIDIDIKIKLKRLETGEGYNIISTLLIPKPAEG